MNTFNTFQNEAFEPYTSAEGYLVFRDEQGRQIGYSTSDWLEDVLPNVIQQAILDARSDVVDTLQVHLQTAYAEKEQSLAVRGAWGPLYEMVWAENAPELERQGREVLKRLQQAKQHLDSACHHLQRVARLEPASAEY